MPLPGLRHLPRNLACLTNAAISIVRRGARFRYLPEAHRHYAARTQEALDAILIAPIARPPVRHLARVRTGPGLPPASTLVLEPWLGTGSGTGKWSWRDA